MANLTERAIKASALKLLNEKPINQITIKDIAVDCGINRNSFYYHFRDLPSLVEEMVMEEAEKLIESYPSISSLDECLDAAVSFALKNRRAAFHIYNSVSRDIYETYLWRICDYVVKKYLDSAFAEISISDSDKEIIEEFYKCACFGEIIWWQKNGMKDDIKDHFTKLCEIKKDMIDEFVRQRTAKK